MASLLSCWDGDLLLYRTASIPADYKSMQHINRFLEWTRLGQGICFLIILVKVNLYEAFIWLCSAEIIGKRVGERDGNGFTGWTCTKSVNARGHNSFVTAASVKATRVDDELISEWCPLKWVDYQCLPEQMLQLSYIQIQRQFLIALGSL